MKKHKTARQKDYKDAYYDSLAKGASQNEVTEKGLQIANLINFKYITDAVLKVANRFKQHKKHIRKKTN